MPRHSLQLAVLAGMASAAVSWVAGPTAVPRVDGRGVITLRCATREAAAAVSPRPPPAHVLLCGGGIQSAAIAYYLSRRGVPSTVVEQSSVACAASGRAGGFLARNWGAGHTAELHRVSFGLHEELATELSLRGFRKMPTLGVTPGARRPDIDALVAEGRLPSWLDRDVAKAKLLDDPGMARRSMHRWDTAQTDPRELTAKFLAAAGSRVVTGSVQGVVLQPSSTTAERAGEGGERVTGVIVDGEVLEADCVVFAMGAWTGCIEDWFPGLQLPMQGIRSTSVVFPAEAPMDPFALFCAADDFGCQLEVFPRVVEDGGKNRHELYVSGVGGSTYLNKQQLASVTAEDIKPDAKRVVAAREALKALSSLGLAAPDLTQACLRPCPPDGMPYLGALHGVSNAFVAAVPAPLPIAPDLVVAPVVHCPDEPSSADVKQISMPAGRQGHNCWGILWAPVTGKAMTELILDGQAHTVDLEPFDPGRFSCHASPRKGSEA